MRCVLTRLYLFIPRQQAANWGLEMFGLNLVNDPMQKLDLFWKMTVILYSCPLQPYAETQWGLNTHTFLFLKLSFSDIRIWNHFSSSRSHKYQINFLAGFCLFVCVFAFGAILFLPFSITLEIYLHEKFQPSRWMFCKAMNITCF